MYSRLLEPPARGKSFFLFGPRGTGKSAWVRERFPGAPYFDLLDSAAFTELLATPALLGARIPERYTGRVVIDEVQKVPAILDEVHRLIETRKLSFVLTGSSARKLRRRGTNLLAGRALLESMHPFTCAELGADFDLERALRHGMLPAAWVEQDPRSFLEAYVRTYLREEVLQEGLTRNLAAFARFLEGISFSQASLLNLSAVARDCSVERKSVEAYVEVLEDLLLAVRIPAFTRRAKRRLALHPKFYFVDCGIFRALRPTGPLDAREEVDGPALETLVLQHLRAHNDYGALGYAIHHFRTTAGAEVDFVLYGERGLHGIEVKRTSRLRSDDLAGLAVLRADYPMARCTLVYGGTRAYHESGVDVVPVERFLRELPARLT